MGLIAVEQQPQESFLISMHMEEILRDGTKLLNSRNNSSVQRVVQMTHGSIGYTIACTLKWFDRR